MKYMGSKRTMLQNGLGHLLNQEIPKSKRFIDLFTGSGSVASFVAKNHKTEVLAYDLQSFSTTLAGSIISRTRKINTDRLWLIWLTEAIVLLKKWKCYSLAQIKIPTQRNFTKQFVIDTRILASTINYAPITEAYGGYYFSVTQALWIDALRATLPQRSDERIIALSALIQAASQCAAAPGHTAQPFQPTRTAKSFIYESWQRSILDKVKTALDIVGYEHALMKGSAHVTDANMVASSLIAGDLIFLDPPYSGVHYSRFYHVLETINNGERVIVDGAGRYPPEKQRPRSNYSMASKSDEAIDDLLCKIAQNRASAILTFPNKSCSNGLSGKTIEMLGCKYFSKVESKIVTGKFSTLGGNGHNRDARQSSSELVLLLKP